MVIGQFTCKYTKQLILPYPAFQKELPKSLLNAACLTYSDLHDYVGSGNSFSALYITDVIRYDKPIEITAFKRWNRTEQNAPCAHIKVLYEPCESCTACNLTRAPQSWCYVEEIQP